MKAFSCLGALACFAPAFLPAQITNRAVLIQEAGRLPRIAPVLVQPAVSPQARESVVDLRLPVDLARYHVLEQQGQTARTATNVTAVGQDEVRAALKPGTTLLFMEKEPATVVKRSDRPETRALFSTFLLRNTTAPQPGAPTRTASGTLTMLADVPTPWISASNAYVNRLSIMFLSEDQAPANAFE